MAKKRSLESSEEYERLLHNKRLQRNRLSAQKSREKKKKELKELEDRVYKLEVDNTSLLKRIEQLLEENTKLTSLLVEDNHNDSLDSTSSFSSNLEDNLHNNNYTTLSTQKIDLQLSSSTSSPSSSSVFSSPSSSSSYYLQDEDQIDSTSTSTTTTTTTTTSIDANMMMMDSINKDVMIQGSLPNESAALVKSLQLEWLIWIMLWTLTTSHQQICKYKNMYNQTCKYNPTYSYNQTCNQVNVSSFMNHHHQQQQHQQMMTGSPSFCVVKTCLANPICLEGIG